MATDDTLRPKPRSRLLLAVILVLGLIGIGVALFPPAFITTQCPRAIKQSLTWARSIISATHVTGERRFTITELRKYDGTNDTPIYLAFGGIVYDVTEKGKQFYGPGMAYSVFAGRDATRALSLGSMKPQDLDRRDVSDFDEQKKKAMQEQYDFYAEKYPRVGTLVD